MTPLLIFFFGVKPYMAVGTDLLFAAFTKMGGTLSFTRQRIVQNRVARALQAFQRGASLAALHELARHQSPLLDSGTESVWIPNIAKIPAPCSRLTTFARTSSVLCPLYSPQLDPTLAFAFTKGAERVSRTALKPFCTRKST
jgi:hypothetical protein